MTKITAPHGSWKSSISAELIAGTGITAFDPRMDGGSLFWLESRPAEGGRVVLMQSVAGAPAKEISPADMNIRTRVHEYGGAPYTVGNGKIFAVNFSDQHLYEISTGGTASLVSGQKGARYADIQIDAQHDRLVCIRESHGAEGEPANSIVSISLQAPHAQTVLADGHDFFAFPRISPDGSKLAFIAWDHPNMPWDDVQLYVADLDGQGLPSNITHLNEGIDESVLDLQWSEQGELFFIADRSGWWNPYRHDGTSTTQLISMDAEFAGPLWSLGQRNYGFLNENTALFAHGGDGKAALTLLDLATGNSRPIPTDCATIGNLVCAEGAAVFEAGFTDDTPALMRFDLATESLSMVARASSLPVSKNTISAPQTIEFPTSGDKTAHAYFYPPHNPEFEAPASDKPPLIVKIHGGPTGQSSSSLQLAIQFWTSRGFAFVDINYGGSSGYGRAYRKRLTDKWGVVDLEDTLNCVRYLAREGLIDPDKAAIRGGSAGGYTTLAALAFSDVFKAGANYYGVSDLEALAKDTHKFEARYLDGLIGPYPEAKQTYMERSPIHHLDGFDQPLIVFQGSEDKVVPPNQSEMIVDVLKKKGVPVAYLLFEGEQHGFRRAENIIRSLEAELYFYGRIFGFDPADQIEPVEIDNLATA